MTEEVGLEKALGEQLQDARKKAGLTQQELCHKAGLSYSTLAKIERGAIKSPSIFTIQSIADTIGVSLDELMGREAPSGVSATPKKTSKNGVKFIYFDINGCLVRFFHRAFAHIAEDTGASPDKIETIFWRHNDEACRGEITPKEFEEAFAKGLGVKSIDWAKYYLEAVEPIGEMQEVITWAAEHYQVGLLSNIMPGFIDAMLKAKLLPSVQYAAIIDSSEVGAIKPEQKIYEVAQEKTGCQPEEIMLVEDERANLMAADKMGWHVLWFDYYRPSESAEKVRSALEF